VVKHRSTEVLVRLPSCHIRDFVLRASTSSAGSDDDIVQPKEPRQYVRLILFTVKIWLLTPTECAEAGGNNE
jgi:hypothetical protein